MNAALRKEIRLLLPAWSVALVAATVPMGVMGDEVGTMEQMSFIFFAGGALLLSLSSFGLEMNFGTFPSLLAQPRPRLDTWQIKIGLLAVALALVAIAAAFSWRLRVHGMMMTDNARTSPWGNDNDHFISNFWPEYVCGLLLFAVIAFAGGLWTTLLFRQTLVAFWFTILVPLVLYGAFLPLFERLVEEGDVSFLIAGLAVVACSYAAVGYCLARWLFLHAQDKQAQEATGMGAWSFLPTFTAPRRPVPVGALLVKELRLQDGTLVIVAVLVLLNLAALAAQHYLPATVTSKYPFLGDVWMVWWVAPLLVGCASVAEERRGLTLESALCLPVGRLYQFAIKLLVVFGVGIFLGAVMPWLLEQLRPASEFHRDLTESLGLPRLLLRAAIITAIGFYASSLSGTLLQALGIAIGLPIILIVGTAFCFEDVFEALWRFSWPVLVLACFCLSYSNFKQLRTTRWQWLRNAIILLLILYAFSVIERRFR